MTAFGSPWIQKQEIKRNFVVQIYQLNLTWCKNTYTKNIVWCLTKVDTLLIILMQILKYQFSLLLIIIFFNN